MNILLSISDLKGAINPIPKYTAAQLEDIFVGRHLKTSSLLNIEGIEDYNAIQFGLVNEDGGDLPFLLFGYNLDFQIGMDYLSYSSPIGKDDSLDTTLAREASQIDSTYFLFDLDKFGGDDIESEIIIRLLSDQSEQGGGGRSVGDSGPEKVLYLTLEQFASFFNMEDDPEPIPEPEQPVF